jgi:hypothetical protein
MRACESSERVKTCFAVRATGQGLSAVSAVK